MKTRQMALWALAASFLGVAWADEQAAPPDLTAAQIVEKNVAARGGLDAWRKVRTMIWLGHVGTENATAQFVLALKRPNKTRFEAKMAKRVALRVYDGTQGWTLRPVKRGAAPSLQPYTPEELKFAHDEHVIDGPLIDYEAKGITIALGGVDDVEGHKAYRLNVTLASGATRHVWVDAQSFLDIKQDRETSSFPGAKATVAVYYRDFQTVDGLKLPFTIERGIGTGQMMDKLEIEKVALNPQLDDLLFEKPAMRGDGRSKSTGARVPPAYNSAGQPPAMLLNGR